MSDNGASPTASHIQRACDLLNAEARFQYYVPKDHPSHGAVRALARQLAQADAEAERVRKVAEELGPLVRFVEYADARERAMHLVESLLPTAPVVDPLVKAAQAVAVKAAAKLGVKLEAYQVEQKWADDFREALAANGYQVFKVGGSPNEPRICPDCNGAGDDGHSHTCWLCDGQGGVIPARETSRAKSGFEIKEKV